MTNDVRWGIIGCGDVAEHKGAPALYNVEGSRLVAVMSRRADRAESFARRHKAARYYTSVEDLLADDEINAVYIATPPNVHAAITAQAAKAGKHVLCEKPMAMTVGECEGMVQVCRDHGVQLMIAYYRRFFPVVMKMKELLDGGAIGKPVRIRAEVGDYFRPRSDGERAWLVDPSTAGGGFLTDVATHRLDLMVHFLGKPREAAAFVDTQHFDFGVDDASSLIVRFDNRVHATGAFNWNVGVAVDEFEICGTEGRIVSRNLGRGDLELITGRGTETFSLPAPSIAHLGLAAHFVECIRTGARNALPGEEGMEATRMTEAAYRSSQEGVMVSLA